MEKLRGLAEVQPRFDSVIGGFEDRECGDASAAR
jgi:hypothetical protein